jgi:enoyl-CoA hydratase/carnithine racemase
MFACRSGIGFFPDVGSSNWLYMVEGGDGVGTFIGLTGARLKAADLIYTRIATHFVPSSR